MIEMTIIYERDAAKILEFPTMKKKKKENLISNIWRCYIKNLISRI